MESTTPAIPASRPIESGQCVPSLYSHTQITRLRRMQKEAPFFLFFLLCSRPPPFYSFHSSYCNNSATFLYIQFKCLYGALSSSGREPNALWRSRCSAFILTYLLIYIHTFSGYKLTTEMSLEYMYKNHKFNELFFGLHSARCFLTRLCTIPHTSIDIKYRVVSAENILHLKGGMSKGRTQKPR